MLVDEPLLKANGHLESSLFFPNKDWNKFLKFLDEGIPLATKNNLRIIIGSRKEKT